MEKDPNLEANQNTLFYFDRSRANLEGGRGRAPWFLMSSTPRWRERGVAGRQEGKQAPFLRRSLPPRAATLLHPGLDAIFGRGGGGGDLS